MKILFLCVCASLGVVLLNPSELARYIVPYEQWSGKIFEKEHFFLEFSVDFLFSAQTYLRLIANKICAKKTAQ